MDIEKNTAEALKAFRKTLPIYNYRYEILSKIEKSKVLLIAGETGCGKTTQIPQYLFEEGMHTSKMIGITQPRRVAAMTVAQRVAAEKSVELGDLVGYSIRFEDKCDNRKTKIKFLTDGMLLREAIIDPLLKRYSVLVIDEAHERTINSDILLGLLKSLLTKRADLKLVIMSATIETEKFMKFFSLRREEIFFIEGRTFPIDVYYTSYPQPDYIDATLNAILQIHFEEKEGGILAFLTGQEDIDDIENMLREKSRNFPAGTKPLNVCPLYSALPPNVQMKAFEVDHEETSRKVVLATNVAETSVTIDGIKYVIDAGFAKIRQYNPSKALESLLITPISKSSALQRSGRAGRQSEGKCFRLYTEEAWNQLRDYSVPEILRNNLAHVVLQMKAIGIHNIKGFEFIDKPKDTALDTAINNLKMIKAIDDEENLTSLGKEMAELPLDPIYAFMLLLSIEKDYSCPDAMLSLIAVMSIENMFYFPKDKKHNLLKVLQRFQVRNSDQLTKTNILHNYFLAKNKKSFCKENFLNNKSLKRAMMIRDQLGDYLSEIVKRRWSNSGSTAFVLEKYKAEELSIKLSYNEDNLKRCLCKSSFNKIAKLNNDGSYLIVKSNQTAHIHPESLCFYSKPKPEYFVFNELIVTKKLYVRDVTEISFADFKTISS